jgi:hypothetical protein
MGNQDTKLSPYYSINENYSMRSSDDTLNNNNNNNNKNSASLNEALWTTKRVNYNNEFKNAMLHELNANRLLNESKRVPQKYITFALNQIRVSPSQ